MQITAALLGFPINNQILEEYIAEKQAKTHYGTMRGKSLAIPEKYVGHLIQYEGQSPWVADSGWGKSPTEGRVGKSNILVYELNGQIFPHLYGGELS